jgi:hypothetical protein
VFRNLIFCLFLLGTEASAYLDYPRNLDLAAEVEGKPYRILPHTQYYTFAIDGDFFKPAFIKNNNDNYYRYDFYHGNGYWMALRAEFKPVPDLVLNLKTDFTHGTSSNGPTYQALIIPHLGLTFRQKLLGFDGEARLSNIDRQTIGAGVFIDQKETDGGYVTLKHNDFFAKLMVDGTGSFRMEGGLVALDVSFMQQILGATFLIQETNTEFNPPNNIGTLYSKKNWDNGLGYAVEVGGHQAAWAGLAFIKFQKQIGSLNFLIKPEARYYGSQILGSVPGNINHNYVSYDQNDKPFTSAMNILSYGDHVKTYSGLLRLEYRFNSFYQIYGENELIQLQRMGRDTIQSDYFRAGFKLYPFKGREDEFGFLIGNKYLNASTGRSGGSGYRTYSSPLIPDVENKPLFLRQTFLMFNFSTKI